MVEPLQADRYNELVDYRTVEAETAVDRDEEIREEIRARLRAASDEKVDGPASRPLLARDEDVAALRLLSGCG